MIHSTHRFHGRSSLRFVYQHGRMVRSDMLCLRAVHNKRQHTWRAAVAVSRKVNKSAVVRNRIRRRIFEVVRRHAGRIAGPYDLVFNIYSDHIAELEQSQLEELLISLMTKASVLAETNIPGPDHAIVDRDKES